MFRTLIVHFHQAIDRSFSRIGMCICHDIFMVNVVSAEGCFDGKRGNIRLRIEAVQREAILAP
jgi:hypothetical protein